MSEHKVRIDWRRTGDDFEYKTYTRDHTWTFENGLALTASATAAYLGNPEHVDPEQAFVASLSSCHMLTLLALATRRKLVVDEYTDDAVGTLGKNEAGRMAITHVTLRPRITFAGSAPDAATLAAIHDEAHRQCFIANSVSTAVRVQQG